MIKMRNKSNEFQTSTPIGKFINNDVNKPKDVIAQMNKKEKSKYYSNKLVSYINKLSKNIFIQSMMSGFMMVIPLLVVGGIFSLIQSVPSSINSQWVVPEWLQQICQKVFNLTYGLAGILSCLCITYEMTKNINFSLKESRQIYPIVTVVASFSCYMLFLVGNVYANGESQVNFDTISLGMLGTRGMLPGLLIAFFVPFIYKWCYKHNWIITLPKIVPTAVSLTVTVLIPLFFSVLIYLLPAWLILHFTGEGIFDWMNSKLNGLYDVSNTYGFYIGYQWLNVLCYFLGIHNSVISNIFESVRQVNVVANAEQVANGLVPNHIYVGATATNMMGGLGSLFMVPIAIILFCQSKQLKSIAKIALIACFFNLPEPILFGLPVIFNPVLLLPFLLAPFGVATVTYGFVHWFGMPAPYVDVAWCLPYLFVLPVSTGLNGLSFAATGINILISFVVWSPFIVIQDRIIMKNERLLTGENNAEFFHDQRNGFQIMWDWLFHHQQNTQILKKVKSQKLYQISENQKKEIQEYHLSISKLQAQAKLKVQFLNQKVIQNNILVVSRSRAEAKDLALAIIAGIQDNHQLVLDVLAADTEKNLRKVVSLAKNAQLILITESARKNYEDLEIIARNSNHILYPITQEEYQDYLANPFKAIELVSQLIVYENHESEKENELQLQQKQH